MTTNASAIAKALKGHRAGAGWSCRCPAHNDRSPSLSVSDGEGGKLLVHCHSGCDPRDVLAALRRLYLLDDGQRQTEQPRHHHDIDGQRKRMAQAREIWRRCQPAKGTPVQAYLESRGFTGEIPPTLRYHPNLLHTRTGLLLPAMVAAVTVTPEQKVVAIHRTFILPDGRGKAPVSPDKAMLGPVRGGAVRLAAAGPVLAVTEGIETGLSIMLATGLPTWAAVSAGGMETLVLPLLPASAELVICADHDASGRGQRAAEILAERALVEGRRAKIALPPDQGDDFNDLLGKAL
jgi:phage/plasmid primase-like uncharacterized protein